MMATALSMHEVGAEAILPPRDITVSRWADENVVLTGSGAAERGQWQTRPYQREPMDVLSPSHPCKRVVLMSSAQMLKTSVLINFLGYIADVDPGPVLVVEPRAEDAKALSKDRVAPLFRHTPCLRGRIAAVKSRDSKNTTLHKVFSNGSGHITFTGAISPSGLAMRPIRYLLLDEVDRYPASAGTEGDPVELAVRRTAEFEHNCKIVMCSTPTIQGISRIERAWNESDQREYFVPCPHCGHYQVLGLGDGTGPGLVWPEDEPEKAQYRCAGCHELIAPHYKAAMVERGEYRAQNPASKIPGFRVTQLISPKRAWGTIAREFVAAKTSTETLKVFLNTVMAQFWEDRHDVRIDPTGLWGRCEPYAAEAPDGVGLITAGVDVQEDRLEVELVGWGKDEESWSLAYHVIPGDVVQRGVWEQLDAILTSEYLSESGQPLRVMAACVDSGYKDATVLRYTRDRYSRRVFAVKGRAGESPIWPRVPSRKNQTPFFMIGVDAAKVAIYDRLKISVAGPGYCHFPLGREVEYFEQLTAEKKFVHYRNGFPRYEWRKASADRNEALDARVYAYAALHALYTSGLRLNAWCERVMVAGAARRKEQRAVEPNATVPAAARKPSNVIRSSFMGNYL